MKYIILITIFSLSIKLSSVSAQDKVTYISLETCNKCDTIINEKKLQTITSINCYYANGEKCAEAVINEKKKKTTGVREKWAWYSVSKTLVIYYDKKGIKLYKEWWKNGTLIKKK